MGPFIKNFTKHLHIQKNNNSATLEYIYKHSQNERRKKMYEIKVGAGPRKTITCRKIDEYMTDIDVEDGFRRFRVYDGAGIQPAMFSLMGSPRIEFVHFKIKKNATVQGLKYYKNLKGLIYKIFRKRRLT